MKRVGIVETDQGQAIKSVVEILKAKGEPATWETIPWSRVDG